MGQAPHPQIPETLVADVDTGDQGIVSRQDRARERLLSAATQVLIANPAASLQDIAREADIGRTTLHRYFPTRAELMTAMTQRALDRLDAAFAQVDFTQAIDAALLQLVTVCLPLGPEMVVVGNSPDLWVGESGGRFSRYSAILAEAIESAQRRGEVRTSVPSWWGAELVMLNLWGGWYMVSGGYAAPKFMPALIVETLMHGLGQAGQGDGGKHADE